jgi:tetratricopeptide (TPR) repeat protein
VPIGQIGEELDVGFVLEGTIRWDRIGSGHGRVRITPQLIRVADDSHLWSERYDRMLEDIFSVQSDIAERVIDQLEVTLLETERDRIENLPTENMEAYQAYLAGIRYVHGSRDEKYVRLSIEMFERAVQLDPGFAVAHAALSTAHSRLHHYRYDFTTERLDKGRHSAERALELQPDLPDAHRALGWYYYWGYRDYDRALEHFRMSAEKAPNDPELLFGTFAVLRRQGRWDDALEGLDRLRRTDPQNYGVALDSSSTFAFLREYESAQKEIRRAIAIAPDHPDAYSEGGMYYILRDGATNRARLLLESAPNKESPKIVYHELLLDLYDRKPESVLAKLEKDSIAAFSLTYWYVPRGLLECTALSRMSERKRAKAACASAVELIEREIEETPHDFLLHIALGHTYALLGRSEEAMRAGEQAVELMPISKDAMDGPDQAIELAKIYTQVGEADKALDLIEEVLSIPSLLSVGLLHLDPAWDPLRNHPRFQALLEKYDVD